MKILDFPLFFTKIGLKWDCICFRIKILSCPVYCIYMPSPYLLLTFSLPTPLQSLRYGKEVDSRKCVQGVGMDGRF